MPDLKAAAELMLDCASASAEEVKLFPSGEWHDRAEHERASFVLAAQALEALAWAEKQKQPIECVLGKWRILGRDQYGHLRYYYADTPLGALLAAMEGEEKDGRD